MRERWTPERDEELGDSVGWDEVEEYMHIQKEVLSLVSKFMVKTGKTGDNFYSDKGEWFSKLVRKYGTLWDVWDAYERKEDIFDGIE